MRVGASGMNIIFSPPDIKGHDDRSKSVSALLGCCKSDCELCKNSLFTAVMLQHSHKAKHHGVMLFFFFVSEAKKQHESTRNESVLTI